MAWALILLLMVLWWLLLHLQFPIFSRTCSQYSNYIYYVGQYEYHILFVRTIMWSQGMYGSVVHSQTQRVWECTSRNILSKKKKKFSNRPSHFQPTLRSDWSSHANPLYFPSDNKATIHRKVDIDALLARVHGWRAARMSMMRRGSLTSMSTQTECCQPSRRGNYHRNSSTTLKSCFRAR